MFHVKHSWLHLPARSTEPMSIYWTRVKEGGGQFLPALLIRLTLRVDWLIRFLIMPVVAGWYLITRTGARHASREFLQRALNRPATLRDLYRHFYCFASVILDRVFLLSGRISSYKITVHGLDLLHHHARTGQGALLFGAHLGSFESLRALITLENCPVRVRPLMWREHTGGLSAALDSLNPQATRDIIDIGRASTALDVQEALGRGELIGLLADRSHMPQRMLGVPFLGKTAHFPAGPLLLAAVTAAPVLLCFGLKTGPRHYTIIIEPFADRITLPRQNRLGAVQEWLQAFTARLEHHARAYPYNWFNFYDFWHTDEGIGENTLNQPDCQPDCVVPIGQRSSLSGDSRRPETRFPSPRQPAI
ncbi:Oligosaccharide acyltransferase family [Granulibacter bethesdensis]|nr:Oligosaccharide acyltransferase family [Granulibacter bethesdensis]